MNLTLYSLLLTGSVTGLLLAILLHCVNTGRTDTDRHARHARRYLTASTVLGAASNLLACSLLTTSTDLSILNSAFIPTTLFIQVFLMTSFFLITLHARHVVRVMLWFAILPFALIVCIGVGTFLHRFGPNFTYDNYMEHTTTPEASVLYSIYLAFILAEVLTCGHRITHSAHSTQSREILGEGRQRIIFQISSATFMLLAVFAIIDLAFLSSSFAPCINIAFTVIAISCTVFSLNHRPQETLEPQETVSVLPDTDLQTTPLPDTSTPSANTPEPTYKAPVRDNFDSEEAMRVRHIINVWSTREEKPFMRPSITLIIVGREMGISPRTLSDFLNKVYDCNFNTWINRLRVEEIKRLLVESPHLSMAELAQLSGFTDASAMTKVFKRIAGETPTTYRTRSVALPPPHKIEGNRLTDSTLRTSETISEKDKSIPDPPQQDTL